MRRLIRIATEALMEVLGSVPCRSETQYIAPQRAHGCSFFMALLLGFGNSGDRLLNSRFRKNRHGPCDRQLTCPQNSYI